jgi:GNAT superfamily N-acetyltransferase
MLINSTIETVDQYWSSALGCAREAFYSRKTFVVADKETGDFHGIYCFRRNESLVIAVSMNLMDAFREQAACWTHADVIDEQRLKGLISYPIERIVGPAFIGYADQMSFRPAYAEGVRFLGSEDTAAFQMLRAACSAIDWEHGGSQLGEQSVVGAFAEARLVAVAGYEVWGSKIAHVAVISHPGYRGQGYGKAAVSRLTSEVLALGLVAQYRTLEANISSLVIARALGFECYATSVAVRLKGDVR